MASSLVDKRESRIRTMFGDIAGSYDLLNHLLSLNIDRYWRWRTTRLAPPVADGPILDVCTGTGDLALAYDRAAHGRLPIIGSDFCLPMLLPARDKTRAVALPTAFASLKRIPSVCRLPTAISSWRRWRSVCAT